MDAVVVGEISIMDSALLAQSTRRLDDIVGPLALQADSVPLNISTQQIESKMGSQHFLFQGVT